MILTLGTEYLDERPGVVGVLTEMYGDEAIIFAHGSVDCLYALLLAA